MAPALLLSHYRRGTVALAVALGTTLSLLTWRVVDRQQADRTHTAFLSRAQTQVTVASRQLATYAEMVHSLRDCFLGQVSVSRQEFNHVAQALLDRHPGVQALEWVQILPQAQRAAFEAQASREVGRPVAVHQLMADSRLGVSPPSDEYWAIAYVEPLAGNESVLGYDVRTAPTAPLLAASRADGKFRVSQTFQLAQSAERSAEPGVIFLLPFARFGSDTPVEGFLQGVFRVQTMLAQSHGLTTNEALDTYYLDVTDASAPPRLLYANLAGEEPMRQPGAQVGLPPVADPADFQHTLELGGRRWLIVVRKNPAWLARVSSPEPLLILAAGMAITVLLALFINLLLHRTRRIEQEVEERTRQLRASEARLQDILDHSPALIFLKDPDGRYLLCNQPFADLCRRPPGEILGLRDEALFPADQAAAYRENDARVLAAGRPMSFEEFAPGPAGLRTCLVHKFPLLDEQGRMYALCGIATDITDRKVAEEQKLALERRLLESQKFESLGVLAGGIAHDFNNILTAILGNASLAALQLPDDHEVLPQLRQVETAARRAGDLCAQMLAYAGKAAFLTAPVNLSSLVRGTTALLEVTVGKRARLDLHLGDGLPSVLGDATQLRQIVMNLVINASDAIGERPAGVISVTTFQRNLAAEFFAQAVQAPSLPDGTYVGLEVRDNGSGMPPEVLARIFEPFFTTKFSGRGLGLAAVLGIVQKHGGALFVESTLGQGTVFRLFLPASTAPAGASASPFSDRPAGERLSGTVLLVDDEPPVRQVAVHALASLGLEILEASDGTAALELYRRHGGSVGVVLLDLMMPGMSGEDTLRQLRACNPAVRVVVMSGYSEGETMQRCAALGVSGYLPKPFEIADLVDRLRPHLGVDRN